MHLFAILPVVRVAMGVVAMATTVNEAGSGAHRQADWKGGTMSTTVTLTLPDDLYARLQRRASDTQRSLADEAIEAMAMTLPTVDELPQPNARELATLVGLDDDHL